MRWWTLETLTTTPAVPACRNRRIASRAHRNAPRRLTARTLSKSALDSSCDGREIWMPALLTSTSSPPSSAAASPTRRTASSSLETSPPDEHVADAVLLNLADAGVDLLLGAGGLLRVAQVVDGDVGAVGGEPHRDRLADAGAAAGDEHVLAIESSHVFLLGSVGAVHTAPTRSDTVQPGPGNVTRIGGSVYGQGHLG